MKTLFSTVIISILFYVLCYSQVPKLINYQAVLRDDSGTILANSSIKLRISIIDSATGGNVVYQEFHKSTTNQFGLITVTVGGGIPELGNFSSITWASGNKWMKVELDESGNTNYKDMGTNLLVSVPYALHAETAGNTDDADADPGNEIQTLTINGNTLSISGGNSITLPQNTVSTDDQNLSLSNDSLFIEDGNFVLLPAATTDTDSQTLSISGNQLSISRGNTIILNDNVNDADADSTNEIQDISLSGTDLSISGGSTVDLSTLQDGVNDADSDPTNEFQTLSINGDTLSISDGNAIALPQGTVNTDDQNLSLSNDSLLIEDGNFVLLPPATTDTDSQTLSISGNQLSISRGNTIILNDNVNDADADSTNELQDINLSGTDLSITGGSTVDLSTIQDGVNDADADPTNEFQTLFINGDTLSISDGNAIALPQGTVNTDDQNLSLSNDSLFIEDGNFVLLPPATTDTDSQTLSVSGNQLSISRGNTIVLNDNVNDADADSTNEIQDISLSGTDLSITGGSTVDLSTLQDGVNDADSDPTNEFQTLSINGDTLSISDGNAIALPQGTVNTDDQNLSLSNDSLFIEDGNFVLLPPATIDTDSQTLSILGNQLSISRGNTIILNDNINDADADSTNEIQDISLSGTDLSITGGSTVDLSTIQDGVNDADADPTNEFQTLFINGDTLSISDGNAIALPQGTVNTDDQNLSLSNDSLFIEDGNFVLLPPATTDTDSQTLSISGNQLSISRGNTIVLNDNVNDADADSTNEIQDISLSGTDLSISGGSTVDLSTLQDGVNDADSDPTNEFQTLFINGDTLSISDGNAVLFPSQTDDDWTVDGNDMYNNNSGNIGVGTNLPDSKLHIVGNEYLTGRMNIGNYNGGIGAGSLIISRNIANYVGAYMDAAAGGTPFYGYAIDQNYIGWTEYSDPDTAWRLILGAPRITVKRLTGNVGIGTNLPESRLHVSGNEYLTGRMNIGNYNGGIGAGSLIISRNVANYVGSYIDAASGGGKPFYGYAIDQNIIGWTEYSDPDTAWNLIMGGTRMTVKRNTGNVGIGTNQPESRLHVSGNGLLSGRMNIGNYNGGIGAGTLIVSRNVSNYVGSYMDAASGGGKPFYGYAIDQVAQAWTEYSDLDTAWKLIVGSFTPRISVKRNTGYVGIGTGFPTERLDVKGKTKTWNFQMTTGATDGYILQSDANGDASWVSPDSVSDGDWTIQNGNMFNNNSGFIGVGVDTALAKLHIQSDSGFVVTGDYNFSTPYIPQFNTNHRSRLIWIPNLAAFRVGYLPSFASTYWDPDSIGTYSIAIGRAVKATGFQGIAIGSGASASGSSGLAMQGGNATNSLSVAIGAGADATGRYSRAICEFCEASGESSFAMGESSIASGDGSIALGMFSKATGDYSLAGGRWCTAYGKYSSAFNVQSTAYGDYSTSFGYTSAIPQYSVVLGHYNIIQGDSTGFNWNDPLFVIGNGQSSLSPSNAMTVMRNGRVGIGTNTPSQNLHVVGNICYTGGIAACSDRRYKKDINQISGALDKVLKMKGVSYFWKQDEYPDQDFDDKKQLGVIAQDMEEILPEVVMTDEEGYKSVDYSRLTPVLIEALKEQNELLKSELNELRKDNEELRSRMDALEASYRVEK